MASVSRIGDAEVIWRGEEWLAEQVVPKVKEAMIEWAQEATSVAFYRAPVDTGLLRLSIGRDDPVFTGDEVVMGFGVAAFVHYALENELHNPRRPRFIRGTVDDVGPWLPIIIEQHVS